MATIRQRGTRWQCIVKRKGHPSISKSFELKKDAEKWGRLQERQIDAGQWIDRSELEQTTLRDLLKRYETEVTPKKRGGHIEASRIKNLVETKLAKCSLASLTPRLIAEYRDTRLAVVSGSTVNRELSLLSHCLTVAVRDWGFDLTSNPVTLVRKATEGKARDRVLTTDERVRLLEAVSTCKNPWIKPVVIFALETAARRGEILALQWSGIDLKRKTARLSVTKTDKPRTVPLSPACIQMLQELPVSKDGRVFPVTVETLKQAYERAVTRAGINGFTFHDLRHDALTRLAKLGLNVLELRAISGHTTANMLQRYVTIDATDLAAKISAA